MSFAYARLTNSGGSGIIFVPSPSGSVYIHVTGSITTSYVRSITLHNMDTVDETVQLWLVPSGTMNPQPTGSSYRFYNEAIPSGATRLVELAIPGFMMVNHGEAVWAGATNANKVSILIMGGQE